MRSEDELLNTHGPLVWSLCVRLCEEPEDAYQQIWEKVLKALPAFDPQGPATARTWIATIAHRHLIDRHRRRQVRGTQVSTEVLVEAPRAPAALEEHQRRLQLERGLRGLPEDQRRVLVLHHLHGVPLATIAEREGVALGTIKSRLHRGRAALVRRLT